MNERPDIDKMIDWPAFYRQRIHSPIHPAGQSKMNCCCPFHEEDHPSFWFNTTNGLWKCEAGCGSGNATAFLARLMDITTGEAYKELCTIAGVPAQENGAKGKAKETALVDKYTVREYAFEKRLPEEWLRSIGVVEGGKDNLGGGYIRINYFDKDRKTASIRKRYHPSTKTRFAWMRGNKARMYGLWQLDFARSHGYAVLVEGESDAQTLWHLGIPAIGTPGASTFQAKWAEELGGIRTLYLHIEPDKGGQVFAQRVAAGLLRGGFEGEVKTFTCAAHNDCKDPSSLYLAAGDGAAAILHAMIQTAAPLDMERAAEQARLNLTDSPAALTMPIGWDVTDDGIYMVDGGKQGGQRERVSWTPLLITRNLPDAATGEMKIELAYRRGGRWRTMRCERGVLASSRRIVDGLADSGINITTENARDVVRFLSELEFENMSKLPETPRITRYGWIDDTHFAPGLCEGYCLDSDNVRGQWATVGQAKGDYDTWKRVMAPHRDRALFRFILASAFAGPLLKPLGQRIFAIHNWCDSLGGKTATMHCALSVWGNPSSIMVTFNTTQAGIESIAEFFSDLILGINERQVAGDKQDFIQKIIYMLSEGSGRLRSNVKGGLRKQATWRNIVLTNGEESLTVDSTMTGVSTRVLELYGKPFPDSSEASEMYRYTNLNHGYAGVDFVKRFVSLDANGVNERYEAMRQALRSHATGHSASHVASVTTVAVADYYASQWVWGEADEAAWSAALGMAKDVLDMLQSAQETDVNERAYRHLLDWILSNKDAFTDRYRAQRYGWLEREKGPSGEENGRPHHVLIIPSKLDEELTRAKFSPKKTLRWLAENEHIDTEFHGGKLRLKVRRARDGVRGEFVRLTLPTDVDVSGFTIVDDEELPFDGALGK